MNIRKLRSLQLGLLLFGTIFIKSLCAQECPGCDCYQFPLPDKCANCCSATTGKTENITDSTITVKIQEQTSGGTKRTFKITPSTKRNSKVIPSRSLVTVYHHGDVAERIDLVEAINGLILPGKESNPPVPDSCEAVPREAFRVYLGDSLGWSENNEMTVIAYRHEPILKIDRTPKGLAIQAKLYGPDGHPSAVIVDNRLYLNPKNSYHLKRISDNYLVLFDENNKGVFGVIYLNPTSVAIRGMFYLPDGNAVSVTDTTITVVSSSMQYGQSCLGNEGTLFDIISGTVVLQGVPLPKK